MHNAELRLKTSRKGGFCYNYSLIKSTFDILKFYMILNRFG